MNFPKLCELCSRPIKKVVIDGRTIHGYWAYMCERCFNSVGVGTGMGKGSKYKKVQEEKWEKVEGI